MAEQKNGSNSKSQDAPPPKRAKSRSPGYPGIDLKQAIERARTVYGKEVRHEAPENTLLDHWGYKPKSGPGLVVIAALKAFGLLETNKETGKLKLSELALDIILDTREDKTELIEAIQKAALNPPIHKILWDKYGAELPSDLNLRYYLLKEKSFTESGAGQLISQYRATLTFASLIEDDRISRGQKEERLEEEPAPMRHEHEAVKGPRGVGGPPLPGSLREIPIPIQGSSWPLLRGTFPLTEDAWKQMLEVLEAMKPGLVAPSTKSGSDEPES